MTDEPSTPMKPQDTIILLLGELKGQMSSLQTSVENRDRAQADINKANEQEHAKFRDDISALSTAVAVLNDNRASQRYTLSERTQKWMTWIAAPSAVAALIGLLFQTINK
jgi:hypothetical protein